MGLILPFRPNKLAFPGGLPGFNGSHIAIGGAKVRLSAVSGNGSFFGLYPYSTPGTNVNTVTRQIVGIGDTCKYATTGYTSLPQSTSADYPGTAAAIFQSTSLNTFSFLFSYDSISSAIVVGGNNLTFRIAGNYYGSSLPTSNNVPYFVIVSCDPVSKNINYLTKRLDTGAVATAVVTASAFGTDFGTPYTIGNFAGGAAGTSLNGVVAAVMRTNGYLSLQAMLAWANDPWSFWYPQLPDLGMMLTTQIAPTFTLQGAQPMVLM
jgi:hypothetical protein